MKLGNLQAGVSLTEILVTTLVLGIGLLGVAALQVSSISSNQEGFYTSQATSIAQDYANRVRSSGRLISAFVKQQDPPDQASVWHTEDVNGYVTAGALVCGDSPGTMCRSNNGSTPAACRVAEMRSFEQWEICDIAKKTLPDGKVRAIRTTSRLTIVVDWASTSERSDLGSKKNVNENCAGLIGSSDRNCVIVELVP